MDYTNSMNTFKVLQYLCTQKSVRAEESVVTQCGVTYNMVVTG